MLRSDAARREAFADSSPGALDGHCASGYGAGAGAGAGPAAADGGWAWEPGPCERPPMGHTLLAAAEEHVRSPRPAVGLLGRSEGQHHMAAATLR